MKLYGGIDLHSSNIFLAIIDEKDRRIFSKRINNNLQLILSTLQPYKEDLEAIVVESTYNWYWLVDGLQEYGYNVKLANPSAIQQYSGLKQTDDKWDSYWLSNMERLKILPKGYIYPKEQRSLRDLLRRRILFVKQRTAQILSLESMITRNLGINISGNDVIKLTASDIDSMFTDRNLNLMAHSNLAMIHSLDKVAMEIEKEVLKQCKVRDRYKQLLTIPGIGNILGTTIILETGDILRFATVKNYSSYCRCVQSVKTSNNKKKGENNRKNGNKYLGWAFIEAANYAIRYCPEAKEFYQRKMRKANRIVALKALSNKLARAAYYIMRDGVSFDKKKLFS